MVEAQQPPAEAQAHAPFVKKNDACQRWFAVLQRDTFLLQLQGGGSNVTMQAPDRSAAAPETKAGA